MYPRERETPKNVLKVEDEDEIEESGIETFDEIFRTT